MSTSEQFNDGLEMFPPRLVSPIPGPKSQEMAERLSRVECAGITYMAEDFPVFWERASGCNVYDVDGNRYVDLTSAFGVAACGHSHPRLAAAAANQCNGLMHGMGDVHPPVQKLEMLEALASFLPGDLGFGVLGQNGADAVEAALKAAFLHTGRAGVISFESGYHGLTGLALETTGFSKFREPFKPLLRENVHRLPYPRSDEDLASLREAISRLMATHEIGAILAEPIQGRGGVVIPPSGFLPLLRELADGKSTVLILDEIYTGFSRTGRRFACEHSGVLPDLICLGKAITGGMPLSVCAGTPAVMGSWPRSSGEAIHTSTYLGHPVACRVAVEAIRLHQELDLASRAEMMGEVVKQQLSAMLSSQWVREVRGQGLMWGIEFEELGSTPLGVRVMHEMLQSGFIALPSGPGGNVLSLSPPLVMDEELLRLALDTLVGIVGRIGR